MSWFLAFVGFALLVVLHEAGHFAAAKAVGMRVEKFSLFFGPMFVKFTRGETVYGIGPIPLGGYVKISGMNPREELPPEVEHRAFFRQPVWKRIVVIAAGPAVNLVLAFVLLFAIFDVRGEPAPDVPVVGTIQAGSPAQGILREGDRIVSVDGRTGNPAVLRRQIGTHRCSETPPTAGCRAATPARFVVERDGRRIETSLTPRYDPAVKRTLVGYTFGRVYEDVGPVRAASLSLDGIWLVSKETVTTLGQIFKAEERDKINGIVGGYETTRQVVELDIVDALVILAFISLSLALINLFPFLPLDGGHIFWAIAEKVRGKAIPFGLMERASVVGIMLVIGLFVIGFTNDIERLRGDGFGIR